VRFVHVHHLDANANVRKPCVVGGAVSAEDAVVAVVAEESRSSLPLPAAEANSNCCRSIKEEDGDFLAVLLLLLLLGLLPTVSMLFMLLPGSLEANKFAASRQR